MDGAIQRFDCARCSTTWFRHGGTSTKCPDCGDEMTPGDGAFVALETEGPAEAGGDAPPAAPGGTPL